MIVDELLFEELTLEPDDEYPYFITAKRYWTTSSANIQEGEERTTLVCLHSTSFHKETWEPTLWQIFQGSTCSDSLRSKIKDAFVIECPNHGGSAVLNGSLLQLPEHAGSFTCDKYARAVYRFLHSKHFNLKGRHRRNLVGLGHSLGGVAMIILQSLLSSISFRELIIVEPMISPLGQESLRPLRTRLVKAAKRRPDTWPDRSIARRSLANSNGVLWDPRVLDVYVKYALKDDDENADAGGRSVTLCCSEFEEAAMYQDDVNGPITPVKDLNEACTRLPIHIILGQLNDFIPKSVQDSIIDPSSPRRFESISYIQGVGHLVPQQAPDALAAKIIALLEGKYDRALTERQERDRRSKL